MRSVKLTVTPVLSDPILITYKKHNINQPTNYTNLGTHIHYIHQDFLEIYEYYHQFDNCLQKDLPLPLIAPSTVFILLYLTVIYVLKYIYVCNVRNKLNTFNSFFL